MVHLYVEKDQKSYPKINIVFEELNSVSQFDLQLKIPQRHV